MLHNARLLIVDDERTTRLSLSEIFTLRGASTATAADGTEAVELLQHHSFDLIVLDIKMPGLSGLQVLEFVQEHSPGTVCVLLTAHATVDSAIHALRQGAFDYILKPAQPKTIIEVVERGLAKRQEFLRRRNLVDLMEQTVEAFKGSNPAQTAQTAPLPPIIPAGAAPQLSTLTFDLQRREVRVNDQELELTPIEFETLAYLMKNAERVVSCRDLVKAVHGYDLTENAARPIMRVHIHRLRQKIERDATNPERLLTIRSSGYMLTSQPRPR